MSKASSKSTRKTKVRTPIPEPFEELPLYWAGKTATSPGREINFGNIYRVNSVRKDKDGNDKHVHKYQLTGILTSEFKKGTKTPKRVSVFVSKAVAKELSEGYGIPITQKSAKKSAPKRSCKEIAQSAEKRCDDRRKAKRAKLLSEPTKSGRTRKAPKSKRSKHPSGLARPLTPYMSFAKAHRDAVKNANPNITFGKIGQKLGEMWRDMSDADKKPLQTKYKKAKEAYDEKIAEYNAKHGIVKARKPRAKKVASGEAKPKKAAAKKTTGEAKPKKTSSAGKGKAKKTSSGGKGKAKKSSSGGKEKKPATRTRKTKAAAVVDLSNSETWILPE